jgi:hypothetical protein
VFGRTGMKLSVLGFGCGVVGGLIARRSARPREDRCIGYRPFTPGESKNAAYYEICGKLSEEDSLIWFKETNHATCFHLGLGASFWRTMMSTLKGIIIIVTIITGSSLAMALNAPATSGQPSAAGSVAGNPAALQHLAQSTPGGVKSGSASNRQKHKHGKYKKTSG